MNIFKADILSFFRKEEGSQSIELVIVVPLLVWSICSMLAFTEAFRVRGVAADATSVIADAISRQTTPIDASYLRGLQSVAGQLTRYGDNVSLRITQLRCVKDCDKPAQRDLNVVFSKGRGLFSLTDSDFASGKFRDRLPALSRGDRVILVETSFTHKPILNVGLKESQIEMSQTTRMRFAPQLCWEKCAI
ncbi:TadE/TadG family type IV pilus assembly protein [Sulfitobacter sp. 1A16787]|uniref:TadE/TadG family type IV pilus assembly protein n=1 Tax=unclassified Sulfitobacter TaxID=196795 RepID=UPI00374775B3